MTVVQSEKWVSIVKWSVVGGPRKPYVRCGRVAQRHRHTRRDEGSHEHGGQLDDLRAGRAVLHDSYQQHLVLARRAATEHHRVDTRAAGACHGCAGEVCSPPRHYRPPEVDCAAPPRSLRWPLRPRSGRQPGSRAASADCLTASRVGRRGKAVVSCPAPRSTPASPPHTPRSQPDRIRLPVAAR